MIVGTTKPAEGVHAAQQQGLYVVEIPYPPVSGNNSVRHTRNGSWLTPAAKAYRYVIANVVRSQGLCLGLMGPLSVEFLVAPPDLRSRDADNFCKTVKDALTHSGFWADDSNKVIRKTVVEWVDKEPGGRVQMTVRQL